MSRTLFSARHQAINPEGGGTQSAPNVGRPTTEARREKRRAGIVFLTAGFTGGDAWFDLIRIFVVFMTQIQRVLRSQ
jgi:hypothetical protein